MTPEQYVFWMQGFFELSKATTLDETQVQIIKDHLDLVFKKVTPKINGGIDFETLRKTLPKTPESELYC